jgi:Rap1a immunity proteins
MRAALIVVLALLGLVQSAQAQNNTGNDLYNWCSAPRDDYLHWGMCYGYIEGVFDVITLTLPLCGYGGANRQQVRDVVFQYLYTHPAERHERANWLASRALKQAFPCQN